MKKIKTTNKLLSALTLATPLTGVIFNSQYQNTQKVITENSDNSLNNYVANQTNNQRQMGDITVNVDGTTITGYVTGTGKLVVDSDITEISNLAFSGQLNISSVNLSNATSLTDIGNFAFDNCSNITGDLVIPSSLTNIGASAFEFCSNLTGDLVIPSSVTSIGRDAFNSTDITSLDLSQATSLTTIGNTAFYQCSNLSGDIVISSSVTSIGSSAFNSTNITSLDLSQATSLTTIGNTAFSAQKLSGEIIFPKSLIIIGSLVFSTVTVDSLYFLSETPPTSFGANWQPTVREKVYVPSEQAKQKYLNASNFGFDSSRLEVIGIIGKISINIDEKSAGSEQYTTIAGFSATKWEIVMSEGDKPEWLSIDNSGILSWTEQCVAGTYKFKIKATNDSQTSIESVPITFVVNESIKPEPTPEKSNIPLILGLVIGLGIPVILAIAFIIWFATKKKKTTVKI